MGVFDQKVEADTPKPPVDRDTTTSMRSIRAAWAALDVHEVQLKVHKNDRDVLNAAAWLLLADRFYKRVVAKDTEVVFGLADKKPLGVPKLSEMDDLKRLAAGRDELAGMVDALVEAIANKNAAHSRARDAIVSSKHDDVAYFYALETVHSYYVRSHYLRLKASV